MWNELKRNKHYKVTNIKKYLLKILHTLYTQHTHTMKKKHKHDMLFEYIIQSIILDQIYFATIPMVTGVDEGTILVMVIEPSLPLYHYHL